jgi:hypothetical protein
MPQISSACIGGSTIIAAGYDASNTPLVCWSSDAGKLWTKVAEIVATDLGSVGAVSSS